MSVPVPGQTAQAPLRRWLRGTLLVVDEAYRRRHGLAPVGPMLYLGLTRHMGEACAFSDGTRLERGAWVGRLHFNNARAAAVNAEDRLQAGVRFARLLRDSFAELAMRVRAEAAWRDVEVFEGVTWLRAHGRAVGFDAVPLPDGPRRWLLGTHFRLLVWAFAPVAPVAAMLDVAPHRYRITRRALIASFGTVRARRSGARRAAGGAS